MQGTVPTVHGDVEMVRLRIAFVSRLPRPRGMVPAPSPCQDITHRPRHQLTNFSACVGALARGAPEPRGAEVKCAFNLSPVIVHVSRLRVFSILPPLHAERGSGSRGATGDAHAARAAQRPTQARGYGV